MNSVSTLRLETHTWHSPKVKVSPHTSHCIQLTQSTYWSWAAYWTSIIHSACYTLHSWYPTDVMSEVFPLQRRQHLLNFYVGTKHCVKSLQIVTFNYGMLKLCRLMYLCSTCPSVIHNGRKVGERLFHYSLLKQSENRWQSNNRRNVRFC